MRRIFLFASLFASLFACLSATAFCLSQTSDSSRISVVSAVKADQPIRVDGVLDEPVYRNIGTDGFVQRDPDEGLPATQKSEVWCAYDDEALYVGARMHDTAPDSIVGQLGRRDESLEADQFMVFLDPYHDRRTGFFFGINPSGSITDGTLYNDSWDDDTWDGVWEGKARIDSAGWTAEIKIPYSQIRFQKKHENVWGVNFKRTLQRRNEASYHVMVPKTGQGFVSHFSDLSGISGIRPARRVEILPYTVGSYQGLIHDDDDPFYPGKSWYGNAGADIKIGLGSNMTLDATFNPDFGQVEVDPAVINLSDYETYYSEKRPFFIEGMNTFEFGFGGATSFSSFNFSSPDFLYTRRIGRPPAGYPQHEGYANLPDRTTILGAGKLTGKLSDSWSLAMFTALTSPEWAEVDSSGIRFREKVEPVASYSVIRSQKQWGEGRSALGVIATGVLRDLHASALSEILNRQAYSLGVDGWTFLDRNKTWVVTGWTGATRMLGDPAVLLRTQTSSAHYFQRPDADHVEVDSSAASLSGWAGRVYINKEKGNWRFNAALGTISPGFDTNDMGYHFRSDILNAHIGTGYRWVKPDKIFRTKSVSLYAFGSSNFDWIRGNRGLFLVGSLQFLNYWYVSALGVVNPASVSATATRGGPLMERAPSASASISVSTDTRKWISGNFMIDSWTADNGGRSLWLSVGCDIRPSSRFRISFSPEYMRDRTTDMWVTRQDDPLAPTFGSRNIFATIDQDQISMSMRINWTFTPALSFQLYMQPLFCTGRYNSFKELARASSSDFNTYGKNGSTLVKEDGNYTVDPDGSGPAEAFTISNPDFHIKSLRGTAVLRWEYRPGSTFFFVWTQDRADYVDDGNLKINRDLSALAKTPTNNIFLVKMTYWWSL